MAVQLTKIVTGSALFQQSPATLLQIEQRNLYFAILAQRYKNVFRVQAAVLPTSGMQARKCGTQTLQDDDMQCLTAAFPTTTGIPLFDILEAIQRLGHQQRLPLTLAVARTNIAHLRHPNAQLLPGMQGSSLAQDRRPPQRIQQ